MATALILVDIQNDYFPGGRMELAGMEAAAENARDILSFFRERRWPVLHVQHIARSSASPFFLPGTPGVEIHPSLRPLPGEAVIQKHYPNSFRETGLRDALTDRAIQDLVICGAMSHMCIDATTRAASDLGFPCTLVHDACATRDLEFGGKIIPADQVHGSFMAALGFGYARVISGSRYLAKAGGTGPS